jgi:hypothetical protein
MSFGIIVPNSLVLPIHGVVRQSCSIAGSNARKEKFNLTVPALFVKVRYILVNELSSCRFIPRGYSGFRLADLFASATYALSSAGFGLLVIGVFCG